MVRFIQWLALLGVVGALACGQAAGQGAIIPTSQPGKAVLHLSAVLNGQVEPLRAGLHWRIYRAQAEPDGSRALVAESSIGQPTFAVSPGDYVVHMAFGLSGQTKRVSLAEEERSERLTLTAGALKITGTLADQPIPSTKLSISIFVPQGHNPEGKLVDEKRNNANNLGGSSITGGVTQAVVKGDMLIVPANTPHQVIPTGGAPIVLMTLPVPHPPTAWPPTN